MYIITFTIIFTIWERERGGRQMHITILYYIIYAHIKFAFDSFISKNTRERERERQREDKQTFIIWSRIVYWELPFYNIHCHSLFVFFSQTVYMYVCQKVRVYYLFSNPLSIIVHQFAFCDTSVPLNFFAKLCAIWI